MKPTRLIIESEEDLTPDELFDTIEEFLNDYKVIVDDIFVNSVISYACSIDCTPSEMQKIYNLLKPFKNN